MDYETLAMEEIIVEMEDGFLSASTTIENPPSYAIENQTINNTFNSENFDAGNWE